MFPRRMYSPDGILTFITRPYMSIAARPRGTRWDRDNSGSRVSCHREKSEGWLGKTTGLGTYLEDMAVFTHDVFDRIVCLVCLGRSGGGFWVGYDLSVMGS